MDGAVRPSATMDMLEPCPMPGQKRTILTYLFASSDKAISRRAKFTEEVDRSSVTAPDNASINNGSADEKGKPRIEDGVIEQMNGIYGEEEPRPLHRTLGRFGAFFNMIAFSIALGILSIPMAVATIGIVPFILLCMLFSFTAWYNGYNYWRLAMMYPGVHNLQQAGELLYGPIGGVIFAFLQGIFSIFVQGSHIILGGYAFWYLGWKDCMVGLAAVFAVISFVFSLPRSYKLFSVFSAISFTSIITVVIIAMISSGVTGPVNKDPDDPPRKLLAFGATSKVPHSFLDGVLYTSNIFVSFGSTTAYLPIMAEMHHPRDFMFSLNLLVAISFVLYVIVGCIMNYNLGQYTKSPSLGSLSPIMVKVSYGLGLPTILVAGCCSGQVTGKMLLVNVFRGSWRYLLDRNWTFWGIWILINITSWALAFVLAELIPFFNTFLGLMASVFWTIFLGFAPLFYFWRHQHDYLQNWRNRLGTLIALGVIGIAGFIMVAGTWAVAVAIRDLYDQGVVGSPFSCGMPV